MVKPYTINGPDEETLTREGVAKLLHVSGATIDRMVADGRFPRPLPTGTQTAKVWAGVDIAAWMHLAGRMRRDESAVDEESDSRKKSEEKS